MSRSYKLPPEAENLLAELRSVERRADELREEFASDVESARREIREALHELEAQRATLEALVHDRARGFDLIGRAWADYQKARAEQLATFLERKPHPARGAAAEVRAKAKELREMARRAKAAEWRVAFYESAFPWLEELLDAEELTSYERIEIDRDESAEDDPTRRWLTAEEYAALPSAERNQLALERYLRSRKTAWQVGRDYERYVGYLREQAGCRVTYQGIFKGLEDLGRDLLAEKDGRIEVIQCKRWAQSKVIHEKHVFQLFGTVIAARIENPGRPVSGTFVTTTALSPRAHEFARILDIAVEEKFAPRDYPRVKCNVARSGERIYHLPFDQQYDSTVVDVGAGERYASTAIEAEGLGFRRAWRWRGRER